MTKRSLIDLTGQTFDRWTVVKLDTPSNPPTRWICRCECGAIGSVQSGDLRRGRSRGCRACREYKGTTKHGKYRTPEYAVWAAMLHRCSCPTSQGYANYGGRGISVCERWHSFETFFEDMGGRPSSKHSIDRIDNDGDYTAENCRWATQKTQRRNTRYNRLITFDGTTQCVAAWAAQLGIHKQTLLNRLNRGWTIERAMTKPVHYHPRAPRPA